MATAAAAPATIIAVSDHKSQQLPPFTCNSCSISFCHFASAGLPQHTETHSNDDMEIKPINPIDSLETRSQSSLSEDLPVDASSTPTPPVRNSTINIPDGGALSSLGGNLAKSLILSIHFFSTIDISSSSFKFLSKTLILNCLLLFFCFLCCRCFFCANLFPLPSVKIKFSEQRAAKRTTTEKKSNIKAKLYF